jgi:MFS family permease
MSNNAQAKLTRDQKEAIGLLSIGTFLEYFDLMLYIHMAVLLNELFFSQSDPHNKKLLEAFAFCSTFVFRPIGAAIFGYIGDNIGRKSTITITTFLMAGCCFAMMLIPTYAQIGFTASLLITACRVIQGMSSMGEIIGAALYVTEIVKPPMQYSAVTLVAAFANLGTIAALLVATLVISFDYNWRYAFGFGMIIALVGGVARQKLRETPDFVDVKLKFSKISKDLLNYKKTMQAIYIIKVFDRLHNLQTLGFQSFYKQIKIAEETMLNIIPLTFYLQIPKIESLLTDICSKILFPSFASKSFAQSELKKKVLKIV